MMGYRTPSPGLLIFLCSVQNIICPCPLKCSCSMKSRDVDCSGRSLTALPHGLQDNITQLNLSHNHFSNLDHQLTRFTNLRSLDLSHNLLRSLPSHLPRSLWEVYATDNNITVLHKLDTAYQWNLKVLDISRNSLQRTVFINNTLISLQMLNLSHNQLWTVPTNMPSNVLTIDLSHNFITQILPGTLVRMPNLQTLYLHNNRFSYIPNDAFDQIFHTREITLHDNPWSCKDSKNMDYLIKWVTVRNNVNPCGNDTKEQNIEVLLTPYEETQTATTDDNLLRTTIYSHFLEVQEIKLYKKVQFSEALPTAPLLTTEHISLASIEDSQFTDEGSTDGMIHLDFNNFGKEIDIFISSNEVEESEMNSPTMILNTDNGISEEILNIDHGLSEEILNSDHERSEEILNSDHERSEEILNIDHGLSEEILNSDHGLSEDILNSDHGISEEILNSDHDRSNSPGVAMPSTTVSVEIQRTTVALNSVPSSAAQKAAFFTVLFLFIPLTLRIV